MKLSKRLLTPLIVISLFQVTSSYAAFNQMIAPNKIPKTIILHTAQANGDVATLSFPNSSLPAKFLCYFSVNNQEGSDVIVRIDSAEDNIEFLPGTNDLMESKANEVKMFTITSAIGNNPTGQIHFTVEKNNSRLSNNAISITCTMHK